MLDHVTTDAPAKLNLHLGIGAPRADGFHPVASIFQAISLSDTVSVRISARPGILLDCPCDCPPAGNTMYRAAAAFLEALARTGAALPGLSMEAVKRIPSGAGLGGGSSDAAAVLKALDVLFPGALPRESLMGIAASVGSDVPFFMGSACSLARGRGEVLEALTPRVDFAAVLLVPPVHVATGPAYAALDAFRTAPGREAPSPEALEEGLRRAARSYREDPPGSWTFANDFFPALSAIHPELARGLDALRAAGAEFAAMTGSGSVLYGLFGDPGRAGEACRALRGSGLEAVEAFPLARLPLSV